MNPSKPYFDNVASNWDTLRTNFFPDHLRDYIVKETFKRKTPKKNSIAADLGAGSGFLTEGLLKAGLNVIAVDQSEKMLKIIKKKNSQYKNKLSAIQADAYRLPIEDQIADYVFANMFLHHIPDPVKAISEATRILKKDGWLIISDLDLHQHSFLITDQYDFWPGFCRNKIKTWFGEAGLHNISVNDSSSHCCSNCPDTSATIKISIFIASGQKKGTAD